MSTTTNLFYVLKIFVFDIFAIGPSLLIPDYAATIQNTRVRAIFGAEEWQVASDVGRRHPRRMGSGKCRALEMGNWERGKGLAIDEGKRAGWLGWGCKDEGAAGNKMETIRCLGWGKWTRLH